MGVAWHRIALPETNFAKHNPFAGDDPTRDRSLHGFGRLILPSIMSRLRFSIHGVYLFSVTIVHSLNCRPDLRPQVLYLPALPKTLSVATQECSRAQSVERAGLTHHDL